MRQESSRHNFLAAGRRWRKTTFCMALAVEEAAQGKTIVWGAPVFDQVRVCWSETEKAANRVATFRKSEMTVYFKSGGRILFRSLDSADNVRGYTADGVVIDEAADVAEGAWYEVLRPMLIDTGGWSWVIGTPKGRDWFWREHATAVDKADHRAWASPTLGVTIGPHGLERSPHPLENPNVAMSEIENLYRTLPERVFRQEIMAEFIEDSGGVFRNVLGCVDNGRQQNEAPLSGATYSMGVDLARIEDFTVLTVFDSHRKQVYFERFNEISWKRQIATILRVQKDYSANVMVDSTGLGDPLFERLREEGIPVQGFTFTNQSKEAAVDALAMQLEKGAIRLMDIPQQTNELLAYQYSLTPSRNVKMGAPARMHDDCVSALLLANQAVGTHREGVFLL